MRTKRVSRRAPTAPSTEQNGFISRADAAKFAALNIQTIDQLIRSGKLRAYRVGRRVLLRRPDVVTAITAEEL